MQLYSLRSYLKRHIVVLSIDWNGQLRQVGSVPGIAENGAKHASPGLIDGRWLTLGPMHALAAWLTQRDGTFPTATSSQSLTLTTRPLEGYESTSSDKMPSNGIR